jgi:hypothetical protein
MWETTSADCPSWTVQERTSQVVRPRTRWQELLAKKPANPTHLRCFGATGTVVAQRNLRLTSTPRTLSHVNCPCARRFYLLVILRVVVCFYDIAYTQPMLNQTTDDNPRGYGDLSLRGTTVKLASYLMCVNIRANADCCWL